MTEPTAPLNPWTARAEAFEHCRRQLADAVIYPPDGSHARASIPYAVALKLAEGWQKERDAATARSGGPIGSSAEHVARKAVAAIRAARKAWRGA